MRTLSHTPTLVYPGAGGPSGAYVPTLGASNGTDDTATINAALALGPIRGLPGQTYIVSKMLPKSGAVVDMTGCTVTQKSGTNDYLLQNYSSANPVATSTDGATTSGSNVVTTSLGAQAVAGQFLIVAGAGGDGNGQLAAVVASATSTTITLDTLDGRPANATATVSAASVTLQNMDTDIRITGGTWTRNQTTYTGPLQGLAFCGVDGLDVDIDKWTSNVVSRGVGPMGVRNATITVRDANAEGVICQINGPAYKVNIPLVRGTCGDDGLALICGDWPGHQLTAGDIIDVEVGTVHVNSIPLVHESGANLYKVISGAGWVADGIKVTGGIHGTCALFAVWLGDGTGTPATTGGTYGHIDLGLIDATPQTTGRILNLVCPSATSIKARIRTSQTTAVLSGYPVLLSGSSPATIGLLELDVDADCANMTSFATFFYVNTGGTDVKQMTVRGRFVAPSTGAPTFFTLSTGIVECLTLDDFQSIHSGQAGYPVYQTGGTLTKVIVRGGTYSAGNCFYRNIGGTSAPIIVFDAPTVSGFGRLAQNVASGITLNAILIGPTITGLTATAFYVSAGYVTVEGHLAPGFTAPLVQRAATETCRVNGATLPVDVSILTPSVGDIALNTNASALYGGASTPVEWDGTSWRATRGYLKTGTATLVAGTVTVADTNITANSVIRLATRTPGGTQGSPYISALTAGTSFAITSTSASDTSVIEYEIVRY